MEEEKVHTPQLRPHEATSQHNSPYNNNILFGSHSNGSNSSLTTKGMLHSQLPKLNTQGSAFNPPPTLSQMGQGISLSPTLNGQQQQRKSSFIPPVTGSPISTSALMNQISSLSLNEQEVYTVNLRNIPPDVSPREAQLIFSLTPSTVMTEIVYDNPVNTSSCRIIARFSQAAEAVRAASMLDNKLVFGANYVPIKAEVDDRAKSKLASNSQLYHGNSISLPKRHTSASSASRSRFMFGTETLSSPMELVPATPNTANAGKSLIMMDYQQDAREYEQLVRGPWSSTANESSMISKLTSQPATPIGFEWGNNGGNTNSNNPENSGNRRASSFFPAGNKAAQQQQQQVQQRGLTKSGSPPNTVSSLNINTDNVPNSAGGLASATPATPLPTNPANNNVDLSLLARVPLPSNPADQNPPCNTLYVGNLPPDATEAELRALFSPQSGFRRLSFKTKAPNNSSSNSHSHGPMCFVEFEDVGYATRALAELYGRQLPRPGGMQSNKGGIRLSFSKNPLGVRGPGQRRGSSNYSGFQYGNNNNNNNNNNINSNGNNINGSINGQPLTPSSLSAPQLPQAQMGQFTISNQTSLA